MKPTNPIYNEFIQQCENGNLSSVQECLMVMEKESQKSLFKKFLLLFSPINSITQPEKIAAGTGFVHACKFGHTHIIEYLEQDPLFKTMSDPYGAMNHFITTRCSHVSLLNSELKSLHFIINTYAVSLPKEQQHFYNGYFEIMKLFKQKESREKLYDNLEKSLGEKEIQKPIKKMKM